MSRKPDERKSGLLLVMMEPEDGYEEELNRWYDEEHIAERMACPGFKGVRRFKSVEGSRRFLLALYDLASIESLGSEKYRWHLEHPTPWTREVQGHLKEFHRGVYEELRRNP